MGLCMLDCIYIVQKLTVRRTITLRLLLVELMQ